MIQNFFRDCNGFSKKCYASNLLNDFEGVLWVITGTFYRFGLIDPCKQPLTADEFSFYVH